MTFSGRSSPSTTPSSRRATPRSSISAPSALNPPNTASFVPGSYRFVIQAPGYGLFRYTKTLAAGASTITLNVPTNWASSAKGATVTAAGTAGTDTTLAALIDDTENTAWSRTVSA